MDELIECRKCKKGFTSKYFKKRGNGSLNKTCMRCLEYAKKYYRQGDKEKMAEYHKVYYQENKEKMKRRMKESYDAGYYKDYYVKNKEKIINRAKNTYKENRLERIDYQKQRYYNNKEVLIKYQRDYFKTLHGRYKSIITQSKRSDIVKNIYEEDGFIDYCFLEDTFKGQDGKCIYCCKLMYCRNDLDRANHPDLITIERKDNSIGHIKNNCVMACYKCNLTRQNRYSHTDFINMKQEEKNKIKI